MSCCVINKREYMKAAGFIAGMLDAGKASRYGLRLFADDRRSEYTPEDIRHDFTGLYLMNVESVRRSWEDGSIAADPGRYDEAFAEYRAKGYAIALEHYDRKTQAAIAGLQRFAASILYQLDDDTIAEAAQRYLARLLFNIRNFSDRIPQQHESEFWGEYTLSMPERGDLPEDW